MGKAFSKMTPRIVRAFTIVTLQRYFSTHPEYTWTPDRSKTELFIQSDFAEDTRLQNIDPILVVEGSGVSYQNNGTTNNLANFDVVKMYQLETYHQFLAEGSINIHCIAAASDAAEELAFEVAMFVQSMRMFAGEMLQLQQITMPQQSKAQLMNRDEWSGNYDSVVSFGYSFAIRRKHTPVDPGEILKEIEAYIHTPNKDKTDAEGKPINNTGETGGTSTGGQSGNWGGNGGSDPVHGVDGVDDGWVSIALKVSNESITGDQN